jgi:hypothetical protein
MDWTTNPLVALYFAVRNTKINKDGNYMDGAVYVLINNPQRYCDLIRDLKQKQKLEQEQTSSTNGEEKSSMVSEQSESGYDVFGIDHLVQGADLSESSIEPEVFSPDDLKPPEMNSAKEIPEPSPFDINKNIIYDPPHISPRIRAQDAVLLACHRPPDGLEEPDYLEIIIKHEAHDDIRHRLEQYGVFDKQLFPELDGIAKWLKYRVFECKGSV